jgi:hypothetical protein
MSALLLPLLLSTYAFADVVDSSANGFTVRVAEVVKASPDEVYRKLVHNVGDWWNSSHTFSGNAHNLSIEEKAGGCFCEKLPAGGGAHHMNVLMFAPGKALVMSGALGPLQSLAAVGTMRIQLAAAEGGTKLEVTYSVAGYVPAGMNTWAAPVDSVLTEQFTRFQNYVERGDPAK